MKFAIVTSSSFSFLFCVCYRRTQAMPSGNSFMLLTELSFFFFLPCGGVK